MSPYSFNLAARNPPFVGAKQMVSRKLRLLGLTETNLDELCKLATSPLLYQAERWRRRRKKTEVNKKQLAAAELEPLKAHLWNITHRVHPRPSPHCQSLLQFPSLQWETQIPMIKFTWHYGIIWRRPSITKPNITHAHIIYHRVFITDVRICNFQLQQQQQ